MKIWLLGAPLLIPVERFGLLLPAFSPIPVRLLICGLNALGVLDFESSAFRSYWVAQTLYFIYQQQIDDLKGQDQHLEDMISTVSEKYDRLKTRMEKRAGSVSSKQSV